MTIASSLWLGYVVERGPRAVPVEEPLLDLERWVDDGGAVAEGYMASSALVPAFG